MHKVKIGEREYTYKRAVIALRKQVDKVRVEFFEALPTVNEHEDSGPAGELWKKAVALMIADPDEALLDLGGVTEGETVDLFAGFIVAAQTKSVSLPGM